MPRMLNQNRLASATITRYLYDGWNPVAEYTGTTLQKSYTWGMDLSGSMQGAGGVGGLLTVELHTGANAGTYHPTYDGNGNISEYLDNTGATVAHYEYDPFGNILVATGSQKDHFAHRFSTKPLDAETGLYYYGYRYYDAAVGRWLSRDPIEEGGGYNLYAFVDNDGINSWDYLGLSAEGNHDHFPEKTADDLLKEKECLTEKGRLTAEEKVRLRKINTSLKAKRAKGSRHSDSKQANQSEDQDTERKETKGEREAREKRERAQKDAENYRKSTKKNPGNPGTTGQTPPRKPTVRIPQVRMPKLPFRVIPIPPMTDDPGESLGFEAGFIRERMREGKSFLEALKELWKYYREKREREGPFGPGPHIASH